jgi:2-C-methyl-D-erythritol 4-phosphate cytidylyltransferase
MNPDRLSIIVAAAGKGLRMGADKPKQYLLLDGKPVLQHTLERLAQVHARETVLVVSPDDDEIESVPGTGTCRVVTGGVTRADSVLNALRAIECDPADWVLVHDGVRPCIRLEDIMRLMEIVGDDEVGGLLAVPVVETVKRADAEGRVEATESRDDLWLAQTPQVFRYGKLRSALEAAKETGVEVTDEASAIERAGHRPCLVEGSRDNIKVTTAEDLDLAAVYLARQA